MRNITGAKRILSSAADLIEDTGWTQGAFCRNARGKACRMGSKDAVSYCLIGAVSTLVDNEDDERAQSICGTAFALLKTVTGVISLDNWNDDPNRTKDDVLHALRMASRA